MKISFCSIAFRHRPMLLEDMIFIISELGYDGIEIWGDHLKGYETSLEKIKKLLYWKNLEVSMISPYFDFTGSTQKWNSSILTARKFIQFAKELDCSLIRCFTGKVSSEFATKRQWKRCIDGIKYIAQIAKKDNITLAIEIHPNTLMDTNDSTMRLLEEVDEDNVKLNLDFYNMWEMDQISPLKLLDKLYPWVVHIHAKNAVLSKGRISPFWYVMDKGRDLLGIRNLSKGDLDYDLILKELINKGYDKYISIECFETRRFPLRVAKEEIIYFRRILSSLQSRMGNTLQSARNL
ncbi:MAG: sugar phosphate isomerase/epimerase [Candidatus Helarchaeota archaeon]|nr:sugar phosphate isomerase/epimerase [Candidatus Helarchaeota archaeon]